MPLCPNRLILIGFSRLLLRQWSLRGRGDVFYILAWRLAACLTHRDESVLMHEVDTKGPGSGVTTALMQAIIAIEQ